MNSIYNDYKAIIKENESVAIVPVREFDLTEVYRVNDITIYPANSVNRSELNENKYDERFMPYQETFFNSALIVFPLGYRRKNIMGSLMPNEKNELLSQIIDKADDVLNAFKYIYSNFDKTSKLPAPSGYLDDIFSGVLLYHPDDKNSDFLIDKYRANSIPIGNTLHVDVQFDKALIDRYMSIFKADAGEIGNVLKNALRLYSNIVVNNNKTNRFLLSMSLIEYLANPYEFEQMKKTKTFIMPFNVKDKKSYHKMSERFKELSGLKVDGVEKGLRTNVVHMGKSLEELIDEDYKVDFLLREVQEYICNVINKLIDHYVDDWQTAINLAEELTTSINKNKNPEPDFMPTMDVLFIIDFDFFNKSIKELYQLYPQYKNRGLQIKPLFTRLSEQVDISRKGYTIPLQIIYKNDEPFCNCDVIQKISELENRGFDSDRGQFDIYATKPNIQYDKFIENLLQQYLYEMNYTLNVHSKFTQIVLISDRNDINQQILVQAERSAKKVYLGRLDNHRTTSCRLNMWFDIQLLFMGLLDIQPWEEVQDNFIYDVIENSN